MGILNIAEIVDIGIEKEKKRRDFYKNIAGKFAGTEIQELFEKLSKWEEEHVEKFSEIRNSISESETVETYSGELEGYMNILIDDRLYKDVTEEGITGKINSPVEAVQQGIYFEKDAILFFTELKNYVQDDNLEVIKKLIKEEKQHIIYLTVLRKSIE